MDYDEDRVYYSYQNLKPNHENDDIPPHAINEDDFDDDDDDNINLHAVKRHFREFLRKCVCGSDFYFVEVFYYFRMEKSLQFFHTHFICIYLSFLSIAYFLCFFPY